MLNRPIQLKNLFQFYLISTFSQYTKPDGNVSWLGVTQFETTGARKSFPCLDEPDKKAQYLYQDSKLLTNSKIWYI